MKSYNLIRGIKRRRHMREHPVMVSVFRKIIDVRENFIALLNRLPQQFEQAARHVPMPEEIVRLAKQFLFRVTGNLQEGLIGILNVPLQVRFADDDLIVAKRPFVPRGYDSLISHERSG